MTNIAFSHRGVEYRFREGDPVLVHAALVRGSRTTVEPFIGEVEAIATPGRWLYVRGRGRWHRVPFDGFSLADGFGRSTDA